MVLTHGSCCGNLLVSQEMRQNRTEVILQLVNVHKLKGKLVENNMSVETLAKAIGVDKSTLYRRFLDGNNFTVGEVDGICKALSLDANEAMDIFFA